MIGSDGNIYEGIGWYKVGAHTYGYNSKSIGIAFIGSFDGNNFNLQVFYTIKLNTFYTEKNASAEALEAGKKLIDCGVALGVFNNNVKLVAARQIQQTRSPGLRLFREIKKWQRWTGHP